jgi:hypothetical protein
VDCYEVLEHVSSVVDDCLDDKLLEEFKNHTRLCVKCKNLFELELLTKKFAKSKLKSFKVPGYLSEKIITQVNNHNKDSISVKKKQNRIINFPRNLFIVTSGLAAVMLVFLLFSVKPQHSHHAPIDNNIIHQAYNNYDAVIEGTIIPTFETTDHRLLGDYFNKTTDHKINVPPLKRCSLTGGTVTEYSGKKIIHILYKNAECIIHCSLIDLNDFNNDKILTMDEGAMDSLKKNGWYFANDYKCCSVILWLKDNTLCTASAELDKDKLFAYLTESESPW